AGGGGEEGEGEDGGRAGRRGGRVVAAGRDQQVDPVAVPGDVVGAEVPRIRARRGGRGGGWARRGAQCPHLGHQAGQVPHVRADGAQVGRHDHPAAVVHDRLRVVGVAVLA